MRAVVRAVSAVWDMILALRKRPENEPKKAVDYFLTSFDGIADHFYILFECKVDRRRKWLLKG